jgi:hypothetical protein
MSIERIAYRTSIAGVVLASLTACSSGDIPLGQAQDQAVTADHRSSSGGSSSGKGGSSGAGASSSSSSGGASSSSSSGGTTASCAPNTALAGPYTLVSKNGVQVTDPIEKVARITIDYQLRVEGQIQIPQCTQDCILFSELSPDQMNIGPGEWGNVGTTDGEFNADKTAFTWATSGLIGNTDAAKYGVAFAGVAIRASVTEPSPCEVKLEASFVREDLPQFVAPTEADLVTNTYILARP